MKPPSDQLRQICMSRTTASDQHRQITPWAGHGERGEGGGGVVVRRKRGDEQQGGRTTPPLPTPLSQGFAHIHKYIHNHTYIHTCRQKKQTDRHTCVPIYKTARQAGWQTDRHTGVQAFKHTCSHLHTRVPS